MDDSAEGIDDGGVRPTSSVGTRVRAILVVVGLTLVAFLVSIAGGIAFLLPLFVLSIDIESPAVFVALTLVGQVGFLAVGFAFARYRAVRIPIRWPSVRHVGLGIGGTVVALVLALVLSIVSATFGLVPGSVIDDAVAIEPLLLVAIAVLSIVVVAPIEEYLFRGVVQSYLREVFGPVGAIAGASLLFGSLHLTNYTGKPSAVIAGALVIAGTGAVLGTLYELTDNLAVPIIAHALYNVILSGLAYLTM